jgi:hypothetical protein
MFHVHLSVIFKKVTTWEQPPSGSGRSKRGFWRRKMEFFADKNTSCYLLSQIKSAIFGGLSQQTERLPFNLKTVSGTAVCSHQILTQN